MKLFKEAGRLYVEENLIFDEIALQLDLPCRTIFYWKKKYEWNRKRFEIERNQGIFPTRTRTHLPNCKRSFGNEVRQNAYLVFNSFVTSSYLFYVV
jgi:hypothetical protein